MCLISKADLNMCFITLNLPNFFLFLQSNPSFGWSLGEDFQMSIEDGGEVVVAGVYLRIFVSNPG